MPALTRTCPNCRGDGEIAHSRRGYGPGDPFATLVKCDRCDGDGELLRPCEFNGCDRWATELVTFSDCTEPYCSRHAVEMRAEAEEEQQRGFW